MAGGRGGEGRKRRRGGRRGGEVGGREYIIGKAGRKTGRWSKEGKRDPIEDDSGDGDELE